MITSELVSEADREWTSLRRPDLEVRDIVSLSDRATLLLLVKLKNEAVLLPRLLDTETVDDRLGSSDHVLRDRVAEEVGCSRDDDAVMVVEMFRDADACEWVRDTDTEALHETISDSEKEDDAELFPRESDIVSSSVCDSVIVPIERVSDLLGVCVVEIERARDWVKFSDAVSVELRRCDRPEREKVIPSTALARVVPDTDRVSLDMDDDAEMLAVASPPEAV